MQATRLALSAALVWGAGACRETTLVASDHCDDCPDSSVTAGVPVDVLFVVDSSASMQPFASHLEQQLPELMQAILRGDEHDSGAATFPPVDSVHVAVVTSDVGVGEELDAPEGSGCTSAGDDGLFVGPSEVELSCSIDRPRYLSHDDDPAPLVSAVGVGCVPLVEHEGCGLEQPLEAVLKALWPEGDSRVAFAQGHGHGSGEHTGFLRRDSLWILIFITDEDDCSTSDPSRSSVLSEPGNLHCHEDPERLYDLERYVDGFERLRPNNPKLVVAVIGGIPPRLVGRANRMRTDPASSSQARAYFDQVLEAPSMQPMVEEDTEEQDARLLPSCTSGGKAEAWPPTRLVEVASAFETRGVLGSLCDEDFGRSTGGLIRAIGAQLLAEDMDAQ